VEVEEVVLEVFHDCGRVGVSGGNDSVGADFKHGQHGVDGTHFVVLQFVLKQSGV